MRPSAAMRKVLLPSIAVLIAAGHATTTCRAGPAEESPGRNPSQGRIVFSAMVLRAASQSPDMPSTRISSVALIGTYHLRPSLNQLSFSGLRATGGLMLGKRPLLWGMPGSSVASSSDDRYSGNFDAGAEAGSGAPYFGIGYTSLGGRKGDWGFSADVGLMSLAPQSIVRLGRGAPPHDEPVRDLRFSPLVQFGVSHSF